jgi:uncharacterized protein YndB with AHSA1/START domain
MTQPMPAFDPLLVTHATFSIERTYPYPPARVFAAHADKAAKRRWQVEGEGFTIFDHQMDFRVGGEESSRFAYGDGPQISMIAQYQAIVENRRIVFSYRMAMGDQPFSASLATIDLIAVPGGTRLTFTEQGAYFGDPDAVKGREEGSRGLLEALAAELDRGA